MSRIINTLILIGIIKIIMPNLTLSQTDDFKVSFSGFVKTDMFYDTRQMVSLREGHISIFPFRPNLDVNGDDINERGNFNILSVQSRQILKIEGPGLFGGKTSGNIETEFLGTADGDINSLRLRHAYVDLEFDGLQIRAGQFWHPLFPIESVPGVISFNTGIPFIPFNRSPQLRVTQKFDNFKLFVAASSQRDFASAGPSGTTPKYLKNTGIPEVSLGLGYSSPNIAIGAVGSMKSLNPYEFIELPSYFDPLTKVKYRNDDVITTFAATAYFSAKIDYFNIKTQVTFGENLSEMIMLGGYGLTSIDANKVSYSPISSISSWLEFMYKKDWEYGLLVGYAQNLGASENLILAPWGRGLDIEKVIKAYPRIAYNFKKTKVGLEAEWTSAYYGDFNINNKAKVEKAEAVNNLRILLAFFVFF